MTSRWMEPALVAGLAGMLVVGTAPAAMAQGGGAARDPRIFVDVSAGVSALAHGFSQTATAPLNAEEETIHVEYGKANAPVFDIGGGVRLAGAFRIQAAFTRSSRTGSAHVAADLPHPLFFNQVRSIDGSVSGVSHTESALHVDLMWRLPISGLHVNVFAGPSLVGVRQELVSGVVYGETYPYDTASFTTAPTAGRSKAAPGVNAGVDIATYFTRGVGVGGILRVTSARARLDSPLGGRVTVKAGGLEAGAGIRLRF